MIDTLKASRDELKRAISRGDLTIAVVGLGWMGLPHAALFAEAGARVIGVDVNPRIVEKANRGVSPIDEPGLEKLLRKHARSGHFRATENISEGVAASDVILLVVPTLIDKNNKPDYSAVEIASKSIGKSIRKGSLVVFESTAGPGITEKIVKAGIEKSSGLKCGEDFGLAYSPMRAMSGRTMTDLQDYCRVVAGVDKKSLDAAMAVLSSITKNNLIRVRDIKTAEASKLFETIYRDVSIGLANQFACFCEAAGIDYKETREAANTQPYSHLLSPGIGVGGHCLPVYPYLLMDEARGFGVRMKLVTEARRANESMPGHVLKLTASALKSVGRSFKRSRIAVLGIAYRPDVKELRFSPTLELIALLKRRGSRVIVFDPKFSQKEMAALGYDTEPTLRKAVGRCDCIVLAVAHSEFKNLDVQSLLPLMNRNPAIVDCTQTLDPVEIEKTGVVYRGVGRGLWTR